ncbi:MAG: alkene reductase [Alphaproteobacteria bacterium]
MDRTALFEPLTLGDLTLPNRVLMAPLTRNRAHPDGTPADMAVPYYRQRASAGLIITEATQINPQGKGYINTPGIHADAHVAAWRRITDAVHDAGGRIFIQLWHVGRISHTSLQPGGVAPLAPSAIRAESMTFTEDGFTPVSAPRAMTVEDIAATVKDYGAAARRALDAGFDGAEIHAANGYLIDQFLRDRTNKRDDAYGGSPENRTRFLAEVTDAVTGVFGPGRVGVRLSPTGTFNDMGDSDPLTTFTAAIDRLTGRGLAYLHLVEKFAVDSLSPEDTALIDALRQRMDGAYLANGDFDGDSGAERIASGTADAITYGRPFISNPDLPRRLRENLPLTTPDQATFYGGDEKGYTDYPAYDGAA